MRLRKRLVSRANGAAKVRSLSALDQNESTTRASETMQRIDERTRGLAGLAALRAFCTEFVPDDALKISEARVVLSFWSSALSDRTFAAPFARDTSRFRTRMRSYLQQAVTRGELPVPRGQNEHADAIEGLLALLNGMQVLAVFTPRQHGARTMERLLDSSLRTLARGARIGPARGKGGKST